MIARRTFLHGATALAALATFAPARHAMAAEGTFPIMLSEEEWRARLTPDQYLILREDATEAQFSHPIQEEFREGTYHCVGCDAALYASDQKFPSDSGWGAFSKAIDGAVGVGPDPTYGDMLPEVHCATCGGHHAHIFNDGPEPLGTRHCVNGLVLNFVPA